MAILCQNLIDKTVFFTKPNTSLKKKTKPNTPINCYVVLVLSSHKLNHTASNSLPVSLYLQWEIVPICSFICICTCTLLGSSLFNLTQLDIYLLNKNVNGSGERPKHEVQVHLQMNIILVIINFTTDTRVGLCCLIALLEKG